MLLQRSNVRPSSRVSGDQNNMTSQIESGHFLRKVDKRIFRWRSAFGAKNCVIQLLLAPTIFGVWYFGFGALAVVTAAVITCYLTGLVLCLMEGKPLKWSHPGSILTGLLIGLTCGAATPLYMIIIGGVIAEFFGKIVLKGPRGNIFNPAVVGRTGIAILETVDPIEYADLSTGASTLFKEAGGLLEPEYINALLGLTKGAIGETSAVILLIVGVVMLRYVVIKWHAPVAMIITVPIAVAVLPPTPEIVGHAPWVVDPILFLIGSPTLLLAFFFVTDPATTPNTRAGSMLFGAGVGLLAVLGKLYTTIAGVEMYGILIMNILTPYFNRLTFEKTS
jgi:electron transport complex protein RnfD